MCLQVKCMCCCNSTSAVNVTVLNHLLITQVDARRSTFTVHYAGMNATLAIACCSCVNRLPDSLPGDLFAMAVHADNGSATLKPPGCVILNAGMPPKVASTPYNVLGACSDCARISSCTTCTLRGAKAASHELRCLLPSKEWCLETDCRVLQQG